MQGSAVMPLYMFSWFVLDLTAALYIALVCRQLPFCRYSYFVFQFLVKIVANLSYECLFRCF